MVTYKIYLSGYIEESKIEECRAWRDAIKDQVPSGFNIEFLDPMDGINYGTFDEYPSAAMVYRDYSDVLASDLIIANMDTFGEQRPLVGTIYELAWAWEHHKPTVIIDPTNGWSDSLVKGSYSNHPFISYSSAWTVKSVEEFKEKKVLEFFVKRS